VLPSHNKLLLNLIQEHQGKFKVAFSITGTALEQFQKYAPKVLESFQDFLTPAALNPVRNYDKFLEQPGSSTQPGVKKVPGEILILSAIFFELL